MRFTSIIAAGFIAVVSAQTTDATTTAVESASSAVESALESAISSASESAASATSAAASATVSIDPAQSSAAAAIQSCLDACDASDGGVNCKAACIAVPSPDTQNVNATTDCVTKCPQGNGTAAENEAYGDCVNACIGQYFFTTSGTPNLATTGAAGASGSATPSVTSVESTITSGGSTLVTTIPSTVAPSGTGSAKTGSGSASTTSSSAGGADTLFTPIGSGVGLFGFLAAFLAL
ncbi:hypothetical protein F5B20DRAFT_581240 [Whalleya microplaca]|nr:hypothetical protein F5B20DRAFT_581240 [Whalleya microplaca]